MRYIADYRFGWFRDRLLSGSDAVTPDIRLTAGVGSETRRGHPVQVVMRGAPHEGGGTKQPGTAREPVPACRPTVTGRLNRMSRARRRTRRSTLEIEHVETARRAGCPLVRRNRDCPGRLCRRVPG